MQQQLLCLKTAAQQSSWCYHIKTYLKRLWNYYSLKSWPLTCVCLVQLKRLIQFSWRVTTKQRNDTMSEEDRRRDDSLISCFLRSKKVTEFDSSLRRVLLVLKEPKPTQTFKVKCIQRAKPNY